MKMTSLKINGRSVSRLSINGREVALGSLCDALCFTAKSNQATVKLTKVGSPDNINLQTSTDGKSWTSYNVGDVITIPNIGGKVYFKAVGLNNKMATSPENYHKFDFIGEFESSGNVNSLLEEDENTARTMSLENRQFCYAYLFSGTLLTKAPELPATTLAYGCYAMMFLGCTSLTQAPALPATTLADFCYYLMFFDCQSLEHAPELPATTLANNCYDTMFSGCSSLRELPALPATTLADFCYYLMFLNCTALTQAPELPAMTLANNCYDHMFAYCQSLEHAPELPATTLANNCYDHMFDGCFYLNSIKVAFTTWLDGSTTNWLEGVAESGTFECPQALIDNTKERTTSTVPASWNMVAV